MILAISDYPVANEFTHLSARCDLYLLFSCILVIWRNPFWLEFELR